MRVVRQRRENESDAHRRLEGRVVLFWTGLLYISAGLGLWGLQSTRPEMFRGWPLVGLAEGTVKNHVSTILDKLHAANRTQAALATRDTGLI